MSYNRRKFLGLSAGALLAATLYKSPAAGAKPRSPIKAIAFDAFPIFDPRPIFGLVKKLYPDKHREFSVLWRTRIFEYTWLLTSAGRYEDFWRCIDQALVFTARQLKVGLPPENHKKLMNAFLTLRAYPDIKPALTELKAAGIKLAFLSNMTDKMLLSNIHNAGLEGYFDEVLSTDLARTFKPAPPAYQLAVDAFGLPRDEIAFTAFASWDAIGAKWFGYPTVWVNRLNFEAEALQFQPDAVGRDISVLTNFVLPAHK